MAVIHNLFFHYSFNIAIKSNRIVPANKRPLLQDVENNDLGSLMDEARSMLEVGSYHENIVNLQGVTCGVEQGTITQVRLPFLYLLIHFLTC